MQRFHIPVIGDVHLGPNARQPQRLAALRQITDAGHLLEDLGAWIYAGDLFHQTSTAADRNLLAAILLSQADVAPVVIIRGNHDQEGDLEIFAKLGARYPIHVCEVAGVLSLTLATGQEMALGVFPWPSEAALIAAGVPVAGIKDAARQALEPLFLDMGQRLEGAAARGLAVAWVGHATVTGAIASNGQPQVGHGIELDGSLLAMLGKEVPKFLGHIHKPQAIADAGAVYVGSVCRLDFGEIEAKRYLVLEGIQEELEVPSDEPGYSRLEPTWFYEIHDRPLDVARLWKVEALLNEREPRAPLALVVTRGPDQAPSLYPSGSVAGIDWTGQEVRVTLRYPVALRENLELWRTELGLEFDKADRYELELVAIPDAGLRAPAVAAATTVEAKVRAWADASGLSLPVHLAEALELLTHNPAEDVLGDVAAMTDELLVEGVPHAV